MKRKRTLKRLVFNTMISGGIRIARRIFLKVSGITRIAGVIFSKIPAGIQIVKRILWPRRLFLRFAMVTVLLLLLFPIVLFAAAKIIPFPSRLLEKIPASQVVYDREDRVLRIFLNRDGNFLIPIDPRDVSPHLVNATIAIEDHRFNSHCGVDGLSVLRALWQDVSSMRIVSGASTITMQVVRLLDPKPRTLFSKISQAFRAVQLESCYSKKQILALYLTLAPYGGNLYGAEAASVAYFGKRARALTLPEAALLAGLPQSPSRLRPDRFLYNAFKRRDLVLAALVKNGYASDVDINPYLTGDSGKNLLSGNRADGLWLANESGSQFKDRSFPFKAPHFCRFIAHQNPMLFRLHTTLDLKLQERVEKFLSLKVRKLPAVSNMSCIVVENKTGEVLAYMGSTDFWSEVNSGQVDGILSFRSPGSTLKPFLYALCYSEGKLSPDEQIPDLPLLNLTWQPDNFDRVYHGIVPAREALSKSYNLPAVRLLFRYKIDRFLSFLKDRRIVRKNADPSASIILGSVSVRPIDLVEGYTALARFGEAVPLCFLRKQNSANLVCPGFDYEHTITGLQAPEKPEKLNSRKISPEACYLVAESLTHAKLGSQPLEGYAWKTGTSWGRRDAWTVAYTPLFTVCVWAGNFAGYPSPSLVGSRAAMPFAVEILSWLDPSPVWPAKPPGIKVADVCAETGLPAGPFCPHVVKGRRLENDNRVCQVHRRFPVDKKTGLLLCRHCISGKNVAWKNFAIWPEDVEFYMEMHGKKPLPLHNPSCPMAEEKGLEFLSPVDGKSYILNEGDIVVKVFAPHDDLYYFLDRKLVKTRTRKFLLSVETGWHTLACIDSRGRSAMIKFKACKRNPG